MPGVNRMKVATIVGTRPEIIRLSRVIAALDEHCDHCLIHTGQNYDYELNAVFFEQLAIRAPDKFLNAASSSASETIGNVIIKVDALLGELEPEAVLILGDTNSCLAAIPAKRRQIPVFHMEAGNRCFDARVPEETNRRIVDHTADINLPYSDIAREYLLAENFPADRIVKTGSPMFEVLNYYRPGIDASRILDQLGVTPGGYFLVSAHREENVDGEVQLSRIAESMNAVAAQYDLPVLVSTHPRTRNRIERFGIAFDERVRLLKPFGFLDYNRLQLSARAVLSDSGTISEEAAILGFPALNIREAHERPEAMEEACVPLTGLDRTRILQGLAMLERQTAAERHFRLPNDYSMPNVSQKVVRIILSYTDYVNRTVWKRY